MDPDASPRLRYSQRNAKDSTLLHVRIYVRPSKRFFFKKIRIHQDLGTKVVHVPEKEVGDSLTLGAVMQALVTLVAHGPGKQVGKSFPGARRDDRE